MIAIERNMNLRLLKNHRTTKNKLAISVNGYANPKRVKYPMASGVNAAAA
jgi:hypothetical protein